MATFHNVNLLRLIAVDNKAAAHMSSDSKKTCIALDSDGVLVDYNLAYAGAWQRAFGARPAERLPEAYWAIDRFQVDVLSGDLLNYFRGHFDEEFWSSIPALPGAAEACLQLVDAGFDLVCVSAMPDRFAAARLHNLQSQGFPIDRVVATAEHGGGRSPKAAALRVIRPVAFVDDFLPYFRGVPRGIHRALVARDPVGSPNVGPELRNVHSQHRDLRAFATWWLHARKSGL